MRVRIMHQDVSQMDLLGAVEAALPHLQGEVRENLEKAFKAMDGQVVMTMWSLDDFSDGAQEAASRAERERALYHLYKYYDATNDCARLEQYLSEIMTERSCDACLKVTLRNGPEHFVPAADVWERVIKLGMCETAKDAAAAILQIEEYQIDSVDTEVHYHRDGRPIED